MHRVAHLEQQGAQNFAHSDSVLKSSPYTFGVSTESFNVAHDVSPSSYSEKFPKTSEPCENQNYSQIVSSGREVDASFYFLIECLIYHMKKNAEFLREIITLREIINILSQVIKCRKIILEICKW